jgi:hypothetical protein
MTLDKIWPRIEAALTGRSKEQTSPSGEKTTTTVYPSKHIGSK